MKRLKRIYWIIQMHPISWTFIGSISMWSFNLSINKISRIPSISFIDSQRIIQFYWLLGIGKSANTIGTFLGTLQLFEVKNLYTLFMTKPRKKLHYVGSLICYSHSKRTSFANSKFLRKCKFLEYPENMQCAMRVCS